ncbi:hypothetical protein [Alcaligenes phenolicus]|uniref:hypothetical protein n=1 Tax=Alcaligenes phenolicus TaxID=232846 RepID=UPI002C5E1EFA|nr:hypothetical protein [Alcaligenes phenolicus]HRO20801.1 hypothetical protein [Alcaligenes phenolicus]HRP13633.1 hypothetical protein [Alcaligenes phenolicus]
MAKQIFFIAITANAAQVTERIEKIFQEERRFRLADDKWFVVFDGMSRELAEEIGIRSNPAIGAGVVLPVDSYSGRASTQMWEWLKLNMERQ